MYVGGFLFQEEAGIRDIGVTGVQTCALPICATAAPWFTSIPVITPTTLLVAGSMMWMSSPALLVWLMRPFAAAAEGALCPDRKSVVEGKRVDAGGRRIIQKKSCRRAATSGRP